MIDTPEVVLSTIEKVYEEGMLGLLLDLKSSMPLYKEQIEIRKSFPGNVVSIRHDALLHVIRTINDFNRFSINLAKKCGSKINNPFPMLPENDIDELERVIESLFVV